MPKPKANSQWRTRIVGYGTEAPDQIVPSATNWKIHPREQQDALSAVLDRVGVVQNVLINKRTGNLVDGHLRVQLALTRHEPSVPVTYIDVSEAEEALLVSVIDPLAAMAKTDHDLLTELFALLPDDLADLAKLAHAETHARTPVAFTAAKSYRVTVECENEGQQARLLTWLQKEGYQCRAGGKR